MRLPLLPILILLVIGVIVDIYLYRRMRLACIPRGWCVAYAALAVVCGATLVSVIFLPKRAGSEHQLHTIMWMLYMYFVVYFPKYVMAVFCLLRSLLSWIFRRPMRWVAYIGIPLGVTVFAGMLHGALVNPGAIDVRRVPIDISRLPASFEGYKIAQISDLHVGTWLDDTTYVAELVDQINALQPDVIVFTGDIVNRRSKELRPFMTTLSRLDAPVYSVMGNHDYGDYFDWADERLHRADADSLKALQADMGWHMLNNASATLTAGTDSIVLLGVENIGDPPFKSHGDFHRAMQGVAPEAVKILLSHNPAHWVDSIADNPGSPLIDLTLSGHTHAMQMQILGWSPAKYRYKTWGGLYDDHRSQRLYVNIGIGSVAFPSRIGDALPEVTLFTLHKSPSQ